MELKKNSKTPAGRCVSGTMPRVHGSARSVSAPPRHYFGRVSPPTLPVWSRLQSCPTVPFSSPSPCIYYPFESPFGLDKPLSSFSTPIPQLDRDAPEPDVDANQLCKSILCFVSAATWQTMQRQNLRLEALAHKIRKLLIPTKSILYSI